MSSTITHWELTSGRFYNCKETIIQIEKHLLYDSMRSKKTNIRNFKRYLTFLNDLHMDKYKCSYEYFEYNEPTCIVCSKIKDDIKNIFSKKRGKLFKLDETPWHDVNYQLQGIYLEVDCDYNIQELMICIECNSNLKSDKEQAYTILYRFWKKSIFPLIRSILREE